MKKKDALFILGITDTDNPTSYQVLKAYREAMQLNHPDKHALDEQQRTKAEERAKLINESKDVLLNQNWTPEAYPRRDYARVHLKLSEDETPYKPTGSKLVFGTVGIVLGCAVVGALGGLGIAEILNLYAEDSIYWVYTLCIGAVTGAVLATIFRDRIWAYLKNTNISKRIVSYLTDRD